MDLKISDNVYNLSRIFTLLIFDECVHWRVDNSDSAYLTSEDK